MLTSHEGKKTMDEKTSKLRDELLLLIMVLTAEVGHGIRFDRLYRPFNYGFGTISDLLMNLVTDEFVGMCFDLHDQPSGYPNEFMPQEQQVKKLHLCFDQSTYVFLTPKGRDEGVRILQSVNKDNCS